MSDLPDEWWGACPVCGKEGLMKRDTDTVCQRCGFTYQIKQSSEGFRP